MRQPRPDSSRSESDEDLLSMLRRELFTAVCTGGSLSYALWGSLMTTRARKLGAAGAVVDGYSRDTRDIVGSVRFPTFSRGSYARDQRTRGRVVDFRCDITFGNGVVLRPGNLIFGDLDGVLIVPDEHEPDIIEQALEKVRAEQAVRTAIEAGMPARQAFDTYGVM